MSERRCLYVTQLPGSVKNLKTELMSEQSLPMSLSLTVNMVEY